jgi:hypothetical protein
MKYSRKSKSRRKSQRKSKSQRGGGWGYTGPAFTTALGVPLEARTFVSDCLPRRDAAPMDMAVQQQGGACGCMAQPPMVKQNGGGGGTGGYGFVLDNSMGKVYDSLSVGACPPATTSPTLAQFAGAGQKGGASPIQAPGVEDPKLYGVVSYPAGYGYTTPVQVNGQSYMDPARYDRTCSGGGRRRRHRKSHRKTRKGGRR